MSYSAKQGSENGFYYNHNFRPNVEYARIIFATAGYEYSIFKNYDAIESSVPEYGVVVSRNDNDEARIVCNSRVINIMEKLISHLKCDMSSTLGCS
jgi:hypothetical protein